MSVSVPGAPRIGLPGVNVPASGGGGGTGLIATATIQGDMNDIATAASPMVTIGQNIPLPTNGWVLALTFASDPGTIDPTKITVNISRPGFTNGVAVQKSDIAFGTIELRRAYPNELTKLGTGTVRYIVLDNQIHAPDTISSIGIGAGFYTGSPTIVLGTGVIVRNDSYAYPDPIARPITLPFGRVDSGQQFTFDITGIHEYAQNAKQLDSVEAWIHDVNGTDGPHATQSLMGRSPHTPPSGRLPSGIPVPSYSMVLSTAGLADGMGEVRYKLYPHFGDKAWTSVTSGGANPNPGQTMTFPAIELPVAGLPVLVDTGNNHSEARAWVNGDGTGLLGTSTAGITLGAADPGPPNSYQSIAAAAAAIKLFNASASGVATFDGSGQKRAIPHNDTSGGVVVLRDVTGTGIGDFSTGYTVGTAVTTSGALPLVIRRGASGSALSPGATSVNCRICGVTRAGATPAAFVIGPKVEYDGISFDGRCGTTAQANCVDTGTGAPTTLAGATGFTLLKDCDVYELTGAAKPCIYRGGWMYHLRVNLDNALSVDSFGGSYTTNFNCLVQTVGSLYTNANDLGPTQSGLIAGVWIQAGTLISAVPPTLNVINALRKQVIYNVRLDGRASFANWLGNIGSNPLNGLGICGLLVRKTNTNTSTGTFRVHGDGAHMIAKNVVLQHISVDSGADDGSSRINWSYQDMAYMQIQRETSMKYAAITSYNIKTDCFNAQTVAGTTNDGTVTVGSRYYYAAIVNDGSGNFYHHIEKNDPNGVGDDLGTIYATNDITDPTKWTPLPGVTASTVYGRQPLRTGNWRTAYSVRNRSIFADQASGSIIGDPDGFWGMVWCRGGSQTASFASMFMRRSGGTLGSGFTDWGDYRPGAGSPLLNAVPSGQAVTPFDLYGTAYQNDGSDAAGAVQHA